MLLAAGATIIMGSFVQDYIEFIFHNNRSAWMITGRLNLLDNFANYVPSSFNWYLFFSGEFLVLPAITRLARRLKKGMRMRSS